MRIISQVDVRPHVLQLPDFALAAKFRPVAAKVLAWAQVDPTATSRARARAVLGWMAAHAVHPQELLHPGGDTLNTDVLPVGETWATFDALFNAEGTITRDQAFWYSFFPNGVSMLQKLIGTTAADGTVADDGMLTEYEPGKWRIRSFEVYRAPQCTLQCKMAQVLLAALGIPGVDISTTGHDPMAYYDIEEGRWLYIDPTFGEMQKVLGKYQTPLDLLLTSRAGYARAIQGEKLPGADYIPLGYFTSPNVPATGMAFMTIHTAPQWAGGLSTRAPYRFGNLPSEGSPEERSASVAEIMPELGVGVAALERFGQQVEIRLRSNWIGHVGFQRSTDAGLTWEGCGSTDYRPFESGEVQYRSINADGFVGTKATILV